MDKLRFYISIIACLLVLVTGIIINTPIFKLTIQLIIAIVIFYIIGGILEIYLKKKVFINDNIIDENKILNEILDEEVENEEPNL